MKNNCKKCDDFDNETKRLMNQVMSQDEMALMVILLSASARGRKSMLAKPTITNKQKMRLLRDGMIGSHLLGKLTVAIDPETLAKIGIELISQGIVLNIKHEKCPHPNEAEATQPQA